MQVQYIRVSTTEQNPERQIEEGIKAYIDKVSGSIPFAERKQASKLLELAEEGLVSEILVHSIDRLGRNTLDILQTIQSFTSYGVNVVSRKEGLNTMIDGKENPVAKMIVSIMATLAEFELERIRERQREGIQKAKERGVYKGNGGRKEETVQEFFSKKKNRACRKYLKQGYSLRASAKLAGVSPTTAQKIAKLIEEGSQA